MTEFAVSRRGYLGALAVLGSGIGLVVPAARAQVPLRVAYLPTLDAVPLFIGLEKGFFAAEGLAIQATPTQGGAAVVPGLMGGAYDIAFGNVVSTLLAKQQGFNLRIVAPGSKLNPKSSPVAGLLTRKADGLRSGKDFEGKSIAVNTRNGVIWLFARSWVKKTGGDPTKVSFKEVPFPQMTDALRAKQVDAVFNVRPFVENAMKEGDIVRTADPYGEVQPSADIGHHIATDEYYLKNQDTVRKFSRALRKSVQHFNATFTTPETQKVMVNITKLSPEIIAKLDFSGMPEFIYAEEYEKTMDLMIDSGLLKSRIDLAAMFDPTQLK